MLANIYLVYLNYIGPLAGNEFADHWRGVGNFYISEASNVYS